MTLSPSLVTHIIRRGATVARWGGQMGGVAPFPARVYKCLHYCAPVSSLCQTPARRRYAVLCVYTVPTTRGRGAKLWQPAGATGNRRGIDVIRE